MYVFEFSKCDQVFAVFYGSGQEQYKCLMRMLFCNICHLHISTVAPKTRS